MTKPIFGLPVIKLLLSHSTLSWHMEVTISLGWTYESHNDLWFHTEWPPLVLVRYRVVTISFGSIQGGQNKLRLDTWVKMSSGWTLALQWALVGYRGHNKLWLDTGVTMSSGWIQGSHNELWLDTGVTMSSGWIQGSHNELWLDTGVHNKLWLDTG